MLYSSKYKHCNMLNVHTTIKSDSLIQDERWLEGKNLPRGLGSQPPQLRVLLHLNCALGFSQVGPWLLLQPDGVGFG